MKEVSEISSIWHNGKLPIRDGMYKANGESFDIRVNPGLASGYEILGEFDLADFLRREPGEITTIDVTRKVAVGSGFVCCGEGSFGSEGFFAHLDGDEELIWLVYLEGSNPFFEVEIDGGLARFRSTAGIEFSAPINSGDLGCLEF